MDEYNHNIGGAPLILGTQSRNLDNYIYIYIYTHYVYVHVYVPL